MSTTRLTKTTRDAEPSLAKTVFLKFGVRTDLDVQSDESATGGMVQDIE